MRMYIKIMRQERSFWKEFNVPVYDIHRTWLRRTVTIVFTPFVMLIVGVVEAFIHIGEVYEDCW